jgi:peptidoglycan/xylan/chitin deacetylase (PgdA/CDA1 family)
VTTGGPGFWRRLFGRVKREAAHLSASKELPVARPTVGLCLNYQRGVAFDSEYLSDLGLEQVLKVLQRHALRATFNCPAKLCETVPDRLKMIAATGHEIAVLGYADESPRELTDDGIKQLVYACRNAFAKIGLRPLGFSAPRSHWDGRLCQELARQRFRYSAEHDHARNPYVIVPGPLQLVRVPVTTDDRGLLHSERTAVKTVAKHHRRLRKAVEGSHFISICFHPWILAEESDRMQHWEEWLQAALNFGAKVGPLADVLPPEDNDATAEESAR